MKYLGNYQYTKLKDGNLMLDFVPVTQLSEITFFVDSKTTTIRIFDGGTTISTLTTIYDFSSKEFVNKFVQICKMYKVSKSGNVLYLECNEDEFQSRLEDFAKALNQICTIE